MRLPLCARAPIAGSDIKRAQPGAPRVTRGPRGAALFVVRGAMGAVTPIPKSKPHHPPSFATKRRALWGKIGAFLQTFLHTGPAAGMQT